MRAFISYDTLDIRKKAILFDLLKANGIEPIVVANKNEPFTDLALKVEVAIEKADFLMPILTKNSILNQWVNQEIGYAKRLVTEDKIKIIPFTESNIVDKLKGFIHDQKDLFIFKSNPDLRSENKAFKAQCQNSIDFIKGNPVKEKQEYEIEAYFTSLFLSWLNRDKQFELGSALTIENKSMNNLAIREISLNIPYEHENFYGEKLKSLPFKVYYYSADGSSKQYFNLNPFLIKPQEQHSLYKLYFKSTPIKFEHDRLDGYQTYFMNRVKELKSVNTTFHFLNGKSFTSVIPINKSSI